MSVKCLRCMCRVTSKAEEMQHQTEARVQHLMDLMVWELNLLRHTMEWLRLWRLCLPRFVALELYDLCKILIEITHTYVCMLNISLRCIHCMYIVYTRWGKRTLTQLRSHCYHLAIPRRVSRTQKWTCNNQRAFPNSPKLCLKMNVQKRVKVWRYWNASEMLKKQDWSLHPELQ